MGGGGGGGARKKEEEGMKIEKLRYGKSFLERKMERGGGGGERGRGGGTATKTDDTFQGDRNSQGKKKIIKSSP